MKKSKKQQKSKKIRQSKPCRLDIRITAELDEQLTSEATARGITKTEYATQILEGRCSPPPMTDGQEEALKQFSAARADLIHISNVLQGKTQEERKALFRNETFMKAWIEGINYLINHWKSIMHLFGG